MWLVRAVLLLLMLRRASYNSSVVTVTLLKLFRRVFVRARSVCFLRHVFPSAYMNATPIGQIFMKFDVRDIYGNLSRKIVFVKVGQKHRGTSREYVLLLPATLICHTRSLDFNV
jgi:hypothetical protein